MIDYDIIGHSIEHYERMGYQRIETPWTVTRAISEITAPPHATFFTIAEKNKVLVASGEQSFLALYNKGILPKGKFQTVTPCFRDEQFDVLHTKYFMKNELIRTDSVNKNDLDDIIEHAMSFYYNFFRHGSKELKVVETGNLMYDITYDGIELGSYGIRKCDFLTWVYGTGVAEPRLSRTLQKYGLS